MQLKAALLLSLVFLAASARSQHRVELASYGFSDGVHPSFSYLFEGTDARYVESFWKDELKKVSGSVSTKKEVIGMAALVVQISTDTVRIYVKADQRKSSPFLTAHVAIQTTAGFIGPDSDPKALEGARAFVEQHTNNLRRQLAQQELTTAEKGLEKLRDELRNLERDKERSEASIDKSRERAAEAVVEQESTRLETEELTIRIAKMKAELATTPDPDKTKELGYLEKDHGKAEKKNRRAQDEERDMIKKAEDLTWSIKQNVEDQAKKSAEITRQELLVGDLREKLSAIR